MYVGLKQPRGDGERYVTPARAAAKETSVMADEERFMRWKISTNTVKNTLKTDTKYSHSVRGRPTLKVEERCRNGLVRKPYERSLWANIYDWTSHRETCYINWAI